MSDRETHTIHNGQFQVLLRNHPDFAGFVARFGDGNLRGRHIGPEFNVCGSSEACNDHG